MAQNSDDIERGGDFLNVLFSCLASNERRQILGHLYDLAPSAVPPEVLATNLAATSQNQPLEQVTDAERHHALTAVHHIHIPRLEAAGLIRQEATDTAVELTEHPAYQDTDILAAITDDVSVEAPSLDVLFRALAAARRRTTLDILSHQYQPIRLRTLAHDLASRQHGGSQEQPEEILHSLFHSHVPHLQEAGLIEYNTDEQTVRYEGHPFLRVRWMHSELGPDFRADLTNTPTDAEIWTIDGRENIVSCGQSLCEEVEEELFMMFTTTGLLEAGCFCRVMEAVDRGVDVYLGTVDPTVREFVREHTPEVTLWEPRTNWLDFPIAEKNVGRLVFADREATLIGTLGEKNDAGVYTEQAIFAEGTDNTLVILLEQMLRSQLDEIADHPEDLESLF